MPPSQKNIQRAHISVRERETPAQSSTQREIKTGENLDTFPMWLRAGKQHLKRPKSADLTKAMKYMDRVFCVGFGTRQCRLKYNLSYEQFGWSWTMSLTSAQHL